MRRFVPVVAMLALVACVDRGSQGRRIDPAYIEANLVDAIPEDLDYRVDADLGGKVVYVGGTIESESARRGEELRLVHYWKVVEPPGDMWRVFAHAVGATERDWLNVDATDMRIGYPPGRWQAGDIIRDEQVFTVPEGWASDYVDLRVGLYRKGGQGRGDRMAIATGPGDDESRVKAARLPIGGAGPGEAEPYAISRAGAAPDIDGKADEPAWEHAAESPAFVLADGGRKMRGEARARLLWDDDHLYALVDVKDRSIYSEFEADGDPLWKQDVVEIFIDADRSGRNYVELQVNPRGARFDAWFPTTRAGGSDEDWDSGMRAAVDVRGKPDTRKSKDEGWTAELAIPLEAVKGGADEAGVQLPPQVGDRWNLNVVRVDEPAEGQVTASSWSQIPISDFHALDRMLTVVFADEDGATGVAQPEGDAEEVEEVDERAGRASASAVGKRADNAPASGDAVLSDRDGAEKVESVKGAREAAGDDADE